MTYNSKYDDEFLELDNCPQFYKAFLSLWQEVRNIFSEDKDITEVIIFDNKSILVNSKPLFFQSWYNAGVIKTNDLLNGCCSFVTFDELYHRFNIPFSLILLFC